MKLNDELPIFLDWMKFLPWIFSCTATFPKHVRASLTMRIENISLDITEKIIEARYSSNKLKTLQELDIMLEKMRILWRVVHTLRFINARSHEYVTKNIANIGRQVGGWQKQQKKS